MEHITTSVWIIMNGLLYDDIYVFLDSELFLPQDAVAFIRSCPLSSCIAATITAHHLLYSRNALFTGGIRPHHYCLPILKRETHRLALIDAAVSGNHIEFDVSIIKPTCSCV